METATVHLDIEADPDDVWSAVTTDEGFATWMGDGAEIQPSPDGEVSAPDPVTGRPKRGRVRSIDDRRIEFTWWPEDDPFDRSDVAIVVEPIEIGTRVRVIERRPLTATASAGIWQWRCAALALQAKGEAFWGLTPKRFTTV